MRAPRSGASCPGLALSGLLDRVSYMPERVLAREMRFRVVGVCRTAGELSYTVASVALAALGCGGMSIVVANVLRSAVRLATMCASVPRASWLAPSRLSMSTVRDMLRFGLPMSVGNAAGFASRRVDNAIVSGLFGADVVGAYNLAYNVADVPAVQVGEQIGDVLFPSFANMDGPRRRAALLRSTGLLALVTFPLAVGLGAIAPTTVETLLRPEWHDVAPMLAVLSVLSVVRPVGWTISSFLAGAGPAAHRRRARARSSSRRSSACSSRWAGRAPLGVLRGRLRVRAPRAGEHGGRPGDGRNQGDGVRSPERASSRGLRPMVVAVLAARHLMAHASVAGARAAVSSSEIVAGAAAYVAVAPFVARGRRKTSSGFSGSRGLTCTAACRGDPAVASAVTSAPT